MSFLPSRSTWYHRARTGRCELLGPRCNGSCASFDRVMRGLFAWRRNGRCVVAQQFDRTFAATLLRWLLPAGLDAGHIRQFMRDTLVAVDARPLLCNQVLRVNCSRTVG